LAKSESARDVGDIEEAVRQSKRTIYVSSSEREDAKALLQLMGLPVIQAPSEGEAQCAHLAKNKYVEGVIGEDIDTLVFGSPILVRNFNRGSEATELCLSEIL
jgi:flap endonuclease-1